MWALDVLDLDASADEKAIKRAYAKKLKVTRPDNDPVAFQQLNEAYQAALAWRKSMPIITEETISPSENQTTLAPEDTSYSDNLTPPTHDQTTFAAKEVKNHHSLYKNCMQLVALDDSHQLQQWLTQYITLLNNEQLHDFSVILINNWKKYFPPVPIQSFDILAEILALEKSSQMLVLRTQLNNIWLAKQTQGSILGINNTASLETSSDITQWCKQCVDIAQQDDPDLLYQWLYEQQNQLSLVQKSKLGSSLINFLLEKLTAIHKKCFLIIIEFFDFNIIDDSHDVDYEKLVFLENKLHQLWVFDEQRIAQLKADDHQPPGRFSQKPIDPTENWQLLEQLYKPFSWLQATFTSIPIHRAIRWGSSTLKLLEETGFNTPDHMDEKQLNFWLKFNQKNTTPLMLAPLTIICLAVFLITLPSLLALNNNILFTNSVLSNIAAITLIFFSFAACTLAGLLFYWYCMWLSIPYEDIDNWPFRIFSALWIPILLIIWFFFCPDSPSPWHWPLLILSLFTAIYRFFGYMPNVFYNPFCWPFAIFRFIKKNIIFYKQKKTLPKTTLCLFFITPIIVLFFMGDIQHFKINTDLPPFIFITTLALWFSYILKD